MKCPKCQTDNPETATFCADCGTNLTLSKYIKVTETLEIPTEELTRGTIFAGRYEIIEELGKGGMGKVYRVEDKKINEEVALKLIKPEIASDKKTIERFSNELKMARKISHRNVCRMYDLNEEDGTTYITMEYVPGEDLKSFIHRSKRLDIGTAISISKQICEGLAEAHRLRVVHRDLKPNNIMIDKEGNVRIMDFGIARSLEAKGITGGGVMIGTPEYMSPEQVEGKDVDQRSDIYSLGCVLYEMLTGNPPFEADTSAALIHKHIKEDPKPPSKLNPQVQEALEDIILKCLEKKPERRYQRAAEIIKAIGEAKPELISVATPSKIQKNSIAVLPFADMSPQKDQEYFCEGVSEELINALNKVKGLQVASRTAAFQFKGKGYDIDEIGKKLKVQTVLEGSVRKAGNKLRITAQLINIADGYHIWSERYDREMDDVFAIQDEISLAIVDNLKVKLLGEEKAVLTKRYTEDFDAYNLYLKGIYFWNRRYEGGLKRGLEYFQQAIQKDPTYALAYAGIAGCYISLGWFDWLHPKEAFTKAKKAAEKALQMDDNIAEAPNSLAFTKFIFDWEWAAAEREFKRALELNPRSADAHHWYSHYLVAMGQHNEAIAEVKKALQLDPLLLIVNGALGWHFFLDHKYDQAIEQYQKTLDLDPSFVVSLWGLGIAYMQKAMYNEAAVAVQNAIDLTGEASLFAVTLDMIYSLAGKKFEAKNLLKKILEQSKQRYVSPFNISLIHLGLNQKDEAFEWLNNAYEQRDHWMAYIKVHPMLDSLRSDPRFTALLKKMNLE